MRILLVEDSATLNEALVRSVRQQGWVCDSAADGLTALQFLASYHYDAVLLDLMLPCLDGWGVLRKLRTAGQAVPVLVISARDQVADRVQALDNGADDYLVKPFALDELLARLRALLRRPAHQETAVLQHGELSIDAHARTVRWRGQDVALTPRNTLCWNCCCAARALPCRAYRFLSTCTTAAAMRLTKWSRSS